MATSRILLNARALISSTSGSPYLARLRPTTVAAHSSRCSLSSYYRKFTTNLRGVQSTTSTTTEYKVFGMKKEEKAKDNNRQDQEKEAMPSRESVSVPDYGGGGHDEDTEVDQVKAAPIEMPHGHQDAPERVPTTDDERPVSEEPYQLHGTEETPSEMGNMGPQGAEIPHQSRVNIYSQTQDVGIKAPDARP